MTRSSFTGILLGGALAVACSKPNPLFLDTWDIVSDSGADSDTSAAPTTVEPTTATTTVPTTEPPLTTTSSTTEPVTGTTSTGSSEPSSTTETTGDGFFCDVDMDGCCEVAIEVEADSFFSDAIDGVGEEGCPLVQNPPMAFKALPCERWSFGKAQSMRLFKDDGTFANPIIGMNVMALKFPSTGDALTIDGKPVPPTQIEWLRLELKVDIAWQTYSDVKLSIHGLGAGQVWSEGIAAEAAVPCLEGASSFGCRQCGDNVQTCVESWVAPLPMGALGTVEAPQGQDPSLLTLDLTTFAGPIADWLPKIAGGLVVAPHSSKYNGETLEEFVPFGQFIIKARESGSPPLLRAKLCEK